MLTAILLSLTVDQIVSRHIEARGGAEALKAVETVVYSRGKYREGTHESERGFMALARPYLKIVSDPEQPATFREGNDGSTWEWYQNPGVVLRTVGAAAAAGRHNTWVEGPFIALLQANVADHPGVASSAAALNRVVAMEATDRVDP